MRTSASHAFDHAPMANCPFMPVFGPPAIMFERGRGTELWDSDGKRYLDFLAGIAVVSLGHSNPVVAEAVGDQLERLLHVSNFFANPVATEAAVKINELLLEATGHARPDLLHQLGRRVERVRHQAGPQARRSRSPHGRQCARQLPRSHARHARRDRAAGQARAVRADARRLPSRCVG